MILRNAVLLTTFNRDSVSRRCVNLTHPYGIARRCLPHCATAPGAVGRGTRPSDGATHPMHERWCVVVAAPRAVLCRVCAPHVDGRGRRIALMLHPAFAIRVPVCVWCKANGLWAEDPRVAVLMCLTLGAAGGSICDVLGLVESPIPHPSAVVVGVQFRPARVCWCHPFETVVAERIDHLSSRCGQRALVSFCLSYRLSSCPTCTLLDTARGSRADAERQQQTRSH